MKTKRIKKHCCQRCGSTENLTHDHIIPKSLLKLLCVHQLNHQRNIQILCLNCNQLKGTALDPKHPLTADLLRYYTERYIALYVPEKVPKKRYVFRTLPVESLTPQPIILTTK